MSRKISIWVSSIFLGSFLKYVSLFYYHLGTYLKTTRNQYLWKNLYHLLTWILQFIEFYCHKCYPKMSSVYYWFWIRKYSKLSFFFFFNSECYIHLVKKRNHFNLTYATNKHLGIQLQFCKARLNVQIITCANDYLWGFLRLPRKVDRECCSLSLTLFHWPEYLRWWKGRNISLVQIT